MGETSDSNLLQHLLPKVVIDIRHVGFKKVDSTWQRPDHVREYNRLFFILEGEGRVTIDGTTYYPGPGQMVITPRTVVSYETVTGKEYRKFYCHFTAKVGEYDLFQLYKFPVVVDAPRPLRQTERLFRKLAGHYKSPSIASALWAKSAFFELFGTFIQQAELRHSAPNSPGERTELSDKICTILDFMERNLDRKLTVQLLAEQLHYHPNYFIRFFHSILGVSPIQYFGQMRIEKAKQALMASDETVSDIARSVGMELPYFSLQFKRSTGYSPSEFRLLWR